MAGRISLLPLAVAALHATSASAIVYIMPTDESMVNRSALIVFGVVRSAGPEEHRGRPATNYVLDIEEVLKGAVGGTTIIVQQPGGVDDDGFAFWILGLPMLADGVRLLLLLRPEEEGVHRVVEYALGLFWEVDVGDPSLPVGPGVAGEANQALRLHRSWKGRLARAKARATNALRFMPLVPSAVHRPRLNQVLVLEARPYPRELALG
ncbi:MAG: hypothetical protein OYL92_12405 [Acidobacteriota bacterium]|nr:hypothetical protein [Acidobacteriota bacterium]MDE3265761.1 hypothetical protein [Acidobacteriota bacterium]